MVLRSMTALTLAACILIQPAFAEERAPLSQPAITRDPASLNELRETSDTSQKAAVSGLETSAHLAETAFSRTQSRTPAAAANQPALTAEGFGTRNPGPGSFKPQGVPPVHGAKKAEVKAASNVYAAEDKNTWTYEGVMGALPFALLGAALGFLVGGPIGAAAGFLAGLFIGAAAWYFSEANKPAPPAAPAES